MKAADVGYAYRLAGFLADQLCTYLPDSFSLAHQELVEALLPLAVRLAITERKATRNKKHAKAYRKVRREVRRYMESMVLTVPAPLETADRPAGRFDPQAWERFDPSAWRLGLVPVTTGAPAAREVA